MEASAWIGCQSSYPYPIFPTKSYVYPRRVGQGFFHFQQPGPFHEEKQIGLEVQEIKLRSHEIGTEGGRSWQT